MYFHSFISIRGCALFSLWNSPHHGRPKTVETKGSNVGYNKISKYYIPWLKLALLSLVAGKIAGRWGLRRTLFRSVHFFLIRNILMVFFWIKIWCVRRFKFSHFLKNYNRCYVCIKGGPSSSVSWDHIFTSLNQYYASLRRETPSSTDMSHSYRSQLRTITPQELEGLIAVLQLTRRVITEVSSFLFICILIDMQHSTPQPSP